MGTWGGGDFISLIRPSPQKSFGGELCEKMQHDIDKSPPALIKNTVTLQKSHGNPLTLADSETRVR